MSARRLVGLAVVLGMAGYSAFHVSLESNLTHFMPEGGESELVAISRHLAESDLARTMVLSIGAADVSTATRAAGRLAEWLRARSEVAWVRSGLDLEGLQALYELYFPRRHYLVSDRPETEIPRLLDDASLRERALALKQQLASPAAPFFARIAARDPLGLFAGILERFQASQPSLQMRNGHFVSRSGEHAIVLLGTRVSAFDYAAQAVLLEAMERELDAIAADLGEPLVMERAGTNRYVVSTQASMRRDFYVVAACAFAGLAVLFAGLIGSLRGFAVVMIPTLGGILVATTSGLLVFGTLDGLTLAFGVALLGVAVDYSVHVLVHQGLGPAGRAPAETARRLRATLTLGALTTAASFGGLAITVFPAFREISFFSIVGLAASLAVTLSLLPGLLHLALPLPDRAAAVARGLAGAGRRLGHLRPGVLALPVAAVLLVGAVTIPRVRWVDDLSKLTLLDPALLAEDERVRSRVSQFDGTRFAIALAADEQTAIERNAEVYARLSRLVDAGHLDGVRSLHALLFSEELQRRNRETLQAQEGLGARTASAFTAAGFRAEALADVAAELAATPPEPLTLADLEASPLGELLSSLVLRLDDRIAIVTYLRGVHAPAEIEAALAGLEGVHLFDQRRFVNDVYREFRTTTVRQLLLGGLLVGAILLARYRRPTVALAALLPSVLVAVTLVEVFALLDVGMNLLHVMSLIIVLGMGVDYGIFIVDSEREAYGPGGADALGVTFLGLLVSCLTTVFVFGTLAISSHPVLRAIGVTTGAGILLSFLFSPLALVVLRARPGRGVP